jgi:hypothetical protein
MDETDYLTLTSPPSNSFGISTPVSLAKSIISSVYSPLSNQNGITLTNSETLSVNGTLSMHGQNTDIMINEKSMSRWMESVEARLHILSPKPELMEKYDALKMAYDHYKMLEALLYDEANKTG